MSRLAVCALLLSVPACSKSAPNKEPKETSSAAGTEEKVMVPGGDGHAPNIGTTMPGAAGGGAKGGADDAFKLQPEEGKLAIEVPADAKAGAETVAKITVTPGAGYHVNTEFPIKLTLATPSGVTLAKAQFIAGGHDKAVGDAEALDEKRLTIAVKLTPAAAGNYTINGDFKFAVCSGETCLAKKEQIAIAVAAK